MTDIISKKPLVSGNLQQEIGAEVENIIKRKRRGRPTNKIETAFRNLPTEFTPIEDYAKQYNVSVHVLRQHNRFGSKVNVKAQLKKVNGVESIRRIG
jgi:hypothetical protein